MKPGEDRNLPNGGWMSKPYNPYNEPHYRGIFYVPSRGSDASKVFK